MPLFPTASTGTKIPDPGAVTSMNIGARRSRARVFFRPAFFLLFTAYSLLFTQRTRGSMVGPRIV